MILQLTVTGAPRILSSMLDPHSCIRHYVATNTDGTDMAVTVDSGKCLGGSTSIVSFDALIFGFPDAD
jgi:hypothetical protein